MLLLCGCCVVVFMFNVRDAIYSSYLLFVVLRIVLMFLLQMLSTPLIYCLLCY